MYLAFFTEHEVHHLHIHIVEGLAPFLFLQQKIYVERKYMPEMSAV